MSSHRAVQCGPRIPWCHIEEIHTTLRTVPTVAPFFFYCFNESTIKKTTL